MKIEKINDTQIRVTLNHTELQNRDIKISELAYGSSKTQALFRDMMAQAYEDFGFEAENVPLMIEAVPLSPDSIMIVVTKVEDPFQIDEKLDALGERPTHRTFKDPVEDRLTDLELMGEKAKATQAPPVASSKTLMYLFTSLDNVSSVAKSIQPLYFGETSLYKYHEQYYLILYANQKNGVKKETVISYLDEFGQRGVMSDLNEYYLKEHGTVIVSKNAIDVLSKLA